MKTFVYKGTQPEIFIDGVGVIKNGESFTTELEINHSEIKEVTEAKKKDK